MTDPAAEIQWLRRRIDSGERVFASSGDVKREKDRYRVFRAFEVLARKEGRSAALDALENILACGRVRSECLRCIASAVSFDDALKGWLHATGADSPDVQDVWLRAALAAVPVNRWKELAEHLAERSLWDSNGWSWLRRAKDLSTTEFTAHFGDISEKVAGGGLTKLSKLERTVFDNLGWSDHLLDTLGLPLLKRMVARRDREVTDVLALMRSWEWHDGAKRIAAVAADVEAVVWCAGLPHTARLYWTALIDAGQSLGGTPAPFWEAVRSAVAVALDHAPEHEAASSHLYALVDTVRPYRDCIESLPLFMGRLVEASPEWGWDVFQRVFAAAQACGSPQESLWTAWQTAAKKFAPNPIDDRREHLRGLLHLQSLIPEYERQARSTVWEEIWPAETPFSPMGVAPSVATTVQKTSSRDPAKSVVSAAPAVVPPRRADLSKPVDWDDNALKGWHKWDVWGRFDRGMRSGNRFVILTGPPGTGKTWLPVVYASLLQGCPMDWKDRERMRSELEAEGVLKIVACRPNWTSPRPLVGGMGALDKWNTGLLEDFLQGACQKPDVQHVLVFDEMNLSSPEHYLSDFISAMETGSDLRSEEAEGHPRLKWPGKNLLMVGTVNVDETTQTLSPRLKSRSWGVEVRTDWKQVLESVDLTPRKRLVAQTLGAIDVALQKAHLGFGYRDLHHVAEYCNGDDVDVHNLIWEAIFQKLLPKLRGTKERLMPCIKALLGEGEGTEQPGDDLGSPLPLRRMDERGESADSQRRKELCEMFVKIRAALDEDGYWGGF